MSLKSKDNFKKMKKGGRKPAFFVLLIYVVNQKLFKEMIFFVRLFKQNGI